MNPMLSRILTKGMTIWTPSVVVNFFPRLDCSLFAILSASKLAFLADSFFSLHIYDFHRLLL